MSSFYAHSVDPSPNSDLVMSLFIVPEGGFSLVKPERAPLWEVSSIGWLPDLLLLVKEVEMLFNHAGECFAKMGRRNGRHAAIRYMPLSMIDQLTRGTELPISKLSR